MVSELNEKTNNILDKIGLGPLLIIIGGLFLLVSVFFGWFSYLTTYYEMLFSFDFYHEVLVYGTEAIEDKAFSGNIRNNVVLMMPIIGAIGIGLAIVLRLKPEFRKATSWALVGLGAVAIISLLVFNPFDLFIYGKYSFTEGYQDYIAYPGLGYWVALVGSVMILMDALPIALNPDDEDYVLSRRASWEIRTSLLIMMFLLLFYLVGAFFGWVFGLLFKSLSWYDCGLWFLIVGVFVCIYCLLAPVENVLEKMGAVEATRENNPRFYNIVEGLAVKASIPTPKMYVLDVDYPNAFALGKSPNSAYVAITAPLLNMLTDDEIEGVMGHELSHILHRDTIVNGTARLCAKVLTIFSVLMGIAALVSVVILGSASATSGRSSNNGSGALIYLILLAILIPVIIVGVVLYVSVPLGSALLKFGVSRSREYSADESSAMLTRKPMALASALERMEKGCIDSDCTYDNTPAAPVMIVCPFGKKRNSFKNRLLDTHPSTESRIERLKKIDQRLRKEDCE